MSPADTFAAELRARFARQARACQQLAEGATGDDRRAHFAAADTWTHAAEMVAAAWAAQRAPDAVLPRSVTAEHLKSMPRVGGDGAAARWRLARSAPCRPLPVHHAEDGTQCCPVCATKRGTPLARALAFVLALCVACAHQQPLAPTSAPSAGQVVAVDAPGAVVSVYPEVGTVWLTFPPTGPLAQGASR